MFRIKKHFQVEVNFSNSVAVGRYDIGDQPDLRGKKITAIETYTATQFSVSYNGRNVITTGTGISVVLASSETEQVRESVYQLPYFALIRSLNGGIYPKFLPQVINWSKSYLYIANTAGLVVGQSAVLSVYYE
jgi:hypothetical protein